MIFAQHIALMIFGLMGGTIFSAISSSAFDSRDTRYGNVFFILAMALFISAFVQWGY